MAPPAMAFPHESNPAESNPAESNPAESNVAAEPKPVEGLAELTLSRIYRGGEFDLDRTTWTWGPPEVAATDVMYRKETDEDGSTEIIRRVLGDSSSSAETTISIPAGPAGRFESYEFSKDGQRLLVKTRSQRVWRHRYLAEYWLFDRNSGSWRAVAGGQRIQFATFSPTEDRIAFVRAGGLYVENVQTGQTQTVAASDQPDLLHGTFDWVYEEELKLKKGFQFNHDGTMIAFWQCDTSGVPRQTLVDNTSHRYPSVKQFAYPKVGQTNSSVRIGVHDFATQQTAWMNLEGDPREHYLAAMQWIDWQSDEDFQERLMIQQLNRRQNQNRLWIAHPSTGEAKVVLNETSPGWVLHQPKLHAIAKPSSVAVPDKRAVDWVWQSERSGWNHLYRLSMDQSSREARLTPITSGEWDVIGIDHVDSASGRIHFTASPTNPTTRGLYRVDADRVTVVSSPLRVSPDEGGTFIDQISPSGRHAIETWSDYQTPPVKRLVTLDPYGIVEVISENQAARRGIAHLSPIRHEFVSLAIDDGVTLDAWIMMPASIAAERSIPLLMHVYGEPAGQTVRDVYGGSGYLWNRFMVQNGIAVASIDNRGTKSPRGQAFRQAVYGKIGILPPFEQAAGVRLLLNRYPVLDPSRVGVWGWSGGGSSSLHAIFRYPDLFKTAVAVAAVPDQLDYDTIYQERYMGLYDDDREQFKNSERFQEGSPIHHAKNLEGSLLIVHGTGDDNVHYASAERLINELIARGKPFEMMAYPGRSHAISEGRGTVMHLRQKMTEFLLRTLGPTDSITTH